jgi:hypothetical protein
MPKPIFSSIPAGDVTYSIDKSSIEIDNVVPDEITSLDVDVAFRLDLKRFPSSKGKIGHQLLLTVAKLSPRAKAAEIDVRHLTDLGVLTFSTEDPDLDDDVICRTENKQDYWTPTRKLRQVWDALTREIEHYRSMCLDRPHVEKRRPLRIAIGGMKYFNGFTSPGLLRVASVYLSEETENLGDPNDRPYLPSLFL